MALDQRSRIPFCDIPRKISPVFGRKVFHGSSASLDLLGSSHCLASACGFASPHSQEGSSRDQKIYAVGEKRPKKTIRGRKPCPLKRREPSSRGADSGPANSSWPIAGRPPCLLRFGTVDRIRS